MMLICEFCHFTFKSDREGRKYCCRPHADRARRRRVTLRCQVCGKAFEVKRSEAKHQRFCGRSCQGRSKRKGKRPTKEQLQHLIERQTTEQVGGMFDVSAALIRKWAKEYGLHSPRAKVVDIEDARKEARHRCKR